MLLQNRCGEPSPEQRAVDNKSATLDKYRREIGDAIKHWQREEARARKTGSEALLSMSSTILTKLNEKHTWTRTSRHLERPQNRLAMERARRRVLSALGISMLLRGEWESGPAVVPNLVGPNGELGTVNDIVEDQRPNPEKRIESRVHTPIAVESALPDDAGNQWYKEGGLWVNQVRPADPTDYLVDVFLPGLGIIEPDFSGHETLYPYVATK